jgi:hypothetical protein
LVLGRKKEESAMKRFLFFILLISISAIVSCVPSSYQSPKVLRPGEKALGAGLAFAKYENVTPMDPFLCFRYGVFDKVDLGLKAFGFPDLGYSVFFDAKYSLLEQPILISGNLGFMAIAEHFPDDDEAKVFGLHPTILLGSEKIYGGIGWDYLIIRETKSPMFEAPYVSIRRESSPRLMIGTSLGGKWKFNSELMFWSDSKERLSGPVVGFGIHRVFIKKN